MDDLVRPEAEENGISVKTQKAKNRYIAEKNKSELNPNAGSFTAPQIARLSAAGADLTAAIASFFPGAGTAIAGIAGFGSTATNFVTDIFDDAVTGKEMWRNLGMNLGMDLLGLIPGGGSAAKFGKIMKVIKPLSATIMAAPGVIDMLSRSPEIAQSWKKLVDSDAVDGGSKMTYQDYMNILQVLNVVSGVTAMGTNVAKSNKRTKVETDKVAVGVKDQTGKSHALIFEGDDAVKFREANKNGKAQEFIDDIEGLNTFKIDEVTTGNHGKFWGKDQNGEFHLFNQSPFGSTGTGRAKVYNVHQTQTNKLGTPLADSEKTSFVRRGRWDGDLVETTDITSATGRTKLEDWKKQQ